MDLSMEPPHFALGIGRFNGARRRTQMPLRHRRRPAQLYPQSTQADVVFTLKPSLWLILPKSEVDPAVWTCFHTIHTGSLKAVYTTLASIKAPSPFAKGQIKLPIGPYKPFTMTNPMMTNPALSLIKANEMIYKNQSVRWAMRRLIHRWRISRLRQINQEDPVTFEAPKELVTIYDWSNRSKYIFEASSLVHDFRNKLNHHDQLFLEPKEPRNPFTNVPLTLGQIHFTLNALRAVGRTNWILEAYRSVAYNITEFQRRFKLPLSLNALNRVFANPTSEECVDLTFDFICSEYENHDTTMPRQDIWVWFLQNRPTHPRIIAWRGWCHAYYRAYLTETSAKFDDLVEGIRSETESLVGQTIHEMKAIWLFETKTKLAIQ